MHCAELTGAPVDASYKTLVMQGKSKQYYVFVIPIACEVDLKKAARSVGEKSVEMIHVKDITKITGYVRGGCSPLGMKKMFPTVIDESAEKFCRNLCERRSHRSYFKNETTGSGCCDKCAAG